MTSKSGNSMIDAYGVYDESNSIHKKRKTVVCNSSRQLIEAEWRINPSVKHSSIGSDNGLLPGRRQAIIWSNSGLLLIGPLVINISEILTKIYSFPIKKIYLKMSSGKWGPFCLGLNVLAAD